MSHEPKNIQTLANTPLPMPLWEFVCLIAALMALNAFAVDIMLPAMGVIADYYHVTGNDQQWLLYSYMIGFGAPQIVFGPITDRFGRKTLLCLCIAAYVVFSFLCMATTSFYILCLVRFLHGLFAAGVRVITTSIVRDLTAGRAMARIMSLAMTVFMIVPIIAPAIGQGVMALFGWKWMFGVLGVAGLASLLWVHFRLPETLAAEDRQELNIPKVLNGFRYVLTTRVTAGYMAASGVIYGALFAFIAAAEQIFEDVFHAGNRFALWFAIISGTLALANYINSRVVERFGMRRMSHGVLIAFIVLSVLNYILMQTAGEKLIYFLPLFALIFGCFGMMGANFSAIAMEPQGKNAGTASALYGFATVAIASIFGYLVSSRFNGTVSPVLLGFVALGVLSLAIVLVTERGKLFEIGAGKG